MTLKKKHTVVWPLVGMIITSNGRSQHTPSAKGGKGKIQPLDRVSCPDTEIRVLPNLEIAVNRFSCPDTDIGVLTTRFPRASCSEKPMRSVPETWGCMYNVLALRKYCLYIKHIG